MLTVNAGAKIAGLVSPLTIVREGDNYTEFTSNCDSLNAFLSNIFEFNSYGRLSSILRLFVVPLS